MLRIDMERSAARAVRLVLTVLWVGCIVAAPAVLHHAYTEAMSVAAMSARANGTLVALEREGGGDKRWRVRPAPGHVPVRGP